MATYRDKKDGFYYIDYYYQGRRIREKIGTSKKLGERVLAKRKVEMAENRYLDVRKQKNVKFEELSSEYFETHSKRYKRSWKSDVHNIKNLNSFFSGKYLYEIIPKLIEDYMHNRINDKVTKDRKISPATVNRELACLKHMFNKAIEWDMLYSNPMKKIKLFKENNKRIRYLEKEQIDTLLNNCSDLLESVVIIALNTGMRKGEIFNLKWRDMNFNMNLIYLIETKNNERREIPMNTLVRNTLIKVRKHPESPYVFTEKNGRKLAPGYFRKSFLTALKKSGIKDFRFHDLRHTFASHLVMSGIDLNTVRELMGHKSIEMTLRYSHLSPDHKRRAVEVLGQRMDSNMDSKAVKENSLEKLLVTTP